MKKNTLNIIIAITACLAAIIGIFTLMSPGFNDPIRGTAFTVIFGSESLTTPGIPLLIVAFSLECVAIGTALFPIFFKGILRDGSYLLTATLTIVSGIIFLLAKSIYISGNPGFATQLTKLLALGSGFIATAVFNFISAVVCVLGIAANHSTTETNEVFKA